MRRCIGVGIMAVGLAMAGARDAQAQMFDASGTVVKSYAALQCGELAKFDTYFEKTADVLLGAYGLGYISGWIDFDIEYADDAHADAIAKAYNATPRSGVIIAAYVRTYCVANPAKSFEAALSQFVHDIHVKVE